MKAITHRDIQSRFAQSTIESTATAGASHKIERSNTLEIYRTRFPEHSAYDLSLVSNGKDSIKYEGIPESLISDGWVLVKDDQLYNAKKGKMHAFHQVWMHDCGCLIEYRVNNLVPGGIKKTLNIDMYIGDSYIGEQSDMDGDLVVTEIMMVSPIGKPPAAISLWNSFVSVLQTYKEKKSTKIGIISHDGREYYVKDFSMDGKIPEFIHTNLHYGEGFEDFHTKMMQRIINETKGLILLHGEPGTGKTQYIRVLLELISQSSKSVLYVPPSFTAQMMEPGMFDFIGDWITEEDTDVIMLIEDAEPLLETRSGDGRSTGISNLLNMTDGILNDMLGLMVIATFNTELERIDSALLRPQRLIARKEFGRIDKNRAEKLSSALGIDCPDIKYPATLADFYTVKKSQEVLIHGVEKKGKTIGFGR